MVITILWSGIELLISKINGEIQQNFDFNLLSNFPAEEGTKKQKFCKVVAKHGFEAN